jgi:hypothetical protein
MPADLVLDGVLGGEDVDVGLVDAVEAGVERGGLAAARGARDQDDAVGPLDEVVHDAASSRREAEVVEAEQHARLVQDAHDDALGAPAGGDGRDADVDALARDLERDAAVLREPLLGDVERRHDLHARRDGAMNCLAGPPHDVELAVDAVAHDDLALLGLDVDVAGALADRLREEAS